MAAPKIAMIEKIFDNLHNFWERPATERAIGVALVWIYLGALVAVELKREGLYPEFLPQPPASHYYSIELAFTLILGLEVVGLIFVLPASLSKCMGKQMEILTLILLRNSFKELAALPEPVEISFQDMEPVIDIAASALGAVCVFLCLGVYRTLVKLKPKLKAGDLIDRYVKSKKFLALSLLLLFLCIAMRDLWLFFQDQKEEFFETIYTVLIFADIAMVLIAQRYTPSYYAVFRNSGYVIGTLMMRLSLSAPPLLCAGLAVFAALYVLGLTYGANAFTPESE